MSIHNKINVAVIGATGYTGLDLTLILSNHPKVKIVKFEDLLVDSENVIKDICKFLQIDFQKEMLRVPLVGSSTVNDAKSKFQFDQSKINKWEKGGLLREIRTKRVQMWLEGRLKKTDVELNGFGPRVMNFLKTLSTPDLFANRG